ncbi:MAG TPA: hypothetical protein VJS92_04275 [Candidatus Polarisedimenticolaceae bacterium]|nr:hypothetical protein [Candidatus Polarisedimenticolaceae bacterium]
MPLDYSIDPARRLVVARGRGILTDGDVFRYQLEVWSRPEIAGYDELVDVSEVTEIAQPPAQRMRELAKLSAEMDGDAPASRLAIVAPSDHAFGLGRMYEAYRTSHSRNTRDVGVFRSLAAALDFLEIRGPLD